MGEIRDFAMALAALVEAFGVKEFSAVRVRTYEDGLKDIPIGLLNAAVRRAIQSREFFPKVAELRADAEACRKELVAAHPFSACEDCNFTGWLEVPHGNVVRSERCACWLDHRARLSAMGALTSVEQRPALPAAREFDARMAQIGEDA